MHPYIALALSLSLTAALFFFDRDKAANASVGQWIALAWVTLLGSRPVTLWLDPSRINSMDALMEGSPLDRMLILGLMTAALIVLISRRFEWRRVAGENRWVFVFFAYLGFSLVWSDYPFIGFKRWIKDLGNLVIVLLILSELKPAEAARAVFVRASYLLVPLSIVLIKYFPDRARYYDPWTGVGYVSGVGTDKNMLGMALTLFALAHLWTILLALRDGRSTRDRVTVLFHVLLLAMIVWLLKRADCGTASACIAVGGATLLMLQADIVRRHIRGLVAFGLCFAALMSVPDFRLLVLEAVTQPLGRNVTFTGRDVLWNVLLRQDINPIFGVGSYSFWMGERVAGPLPGVPGWTNSAHNAYLEIYLNVGLVGLGLYLGILASGFAGTMRDLASRHNDATPSFRLAFLVVMVFYGVTEAIVRMNLLWLGLLIVVTCLPSQNGIVPVVKASAQMRVFSKPKVVDANTVKSRVDIRSKFSGARPAVKNEPAAGD